MEKGRRMSGFPRDLAVLDPWDASLERSRARRARAGRTSGRRRRHTDAHGSQLSAAGRSAGAALDLRSIEARDRQREARDLAAQDLWELSLGRSRARRRAVELRFVPAGTRAKRVSLGALAALTVGPTASLADGQATLTPGAPNPEPPTTTEHNIVLSVESEGRQVELLQQAVGGIKVDGIFGPETEEAVRAFQASSGLTVDGIVGPTTSAALRGQAPAKASLAAVPRDVAAVASPEGTSEPGGGHAVARLQAALQLQADGDFGPETEAAIRRLQARHGLTVDGVVGAATWSVIGVSGESTLHPPHAALSVRSSSGSGGSSNSPTSGGEGESSGVVARVIAAGDEIASRPYVYGGGHGSFQSSGYDCSGSVSYALHGGGLLSSPEDSTGLESYGEAGPGKHITVYANAGHAYMVVDGKRFDTVAQQETGTRWSSSTTSAAGYVARHPAGL
jgi:peptidoglycan hydrolase-like protein with peptidoglycan-binding domain